MLWILITSMVTLWFPSNDLSKESYPQDYFISPVQHDLKLSGTFGELRSNHFHSGIDIKPSNGGIGDPVLAAAEGEIVRISVSSGGFGNALYVQHPNGYITVYAHLHNFMPEVAKYVKSQQYQRKSFRVNLYPSGQFPVAQGQRIGTLGNSGSSTGAHLHFEIRRAANAKPINPLYFGFKIEDQVKPDIKHLIVYELDQRLNVLKRTTYPIHFNTPLDTLFVQSNLIGLAVQSYDQMNNLRNKNGVFKLEQWVDNQSTFSMEFESFHFSETRYLNAHCDYHLYEQDQIRAHRLYNVPGNGFSLCQPKTQSGCIEIQNHEIKDIAIRVQDFNGNTEEVNLVIKGYEIRNRIASQQPNTLLFKHDEDNSISTADFQISIPKGFLYEDAHVNYVASSDQSDGLFSRTHILSSDPIPVHKYFEIKIKPNILPARYQQKAFIGNCSNASRSVSCGGSWKGSYLTAQVRELGNYVVMIDTVPPTITPEQFNTEMQGYKKMSFQIDDNIATSGKARDLKYEATVDGDWILFEYDAKKNRIFHTFDGRIAQGSHELIITVTDDRQNTSIFKKRFNI